jgi:hypothetical protein
MTPEEMQALVNMGGAIDNETTAETNEALGIAPEPTQEQIAEKAANDWVVVPEILSAAITAYMPETTPYYTEEGNLRFAEKLGAVAEKYGWNSPGASPEISLAIASIGFAAPAFMAYKKRKAEAEKQEEEKEKKGGLNVVNLNPERG